MRRPFATPTLSALLATTLVLAPMRAAFASDDAPPTPDAAGAPSSTTDIDATVKPSTPIGGVKVTLRGDRRLRLEHEELVSADSTATRFAVVCSAPCDIVVPSGTGYRVTGDGLRTSGNFTLDAGTRVIDADLGSKTTWAMAPWLVVGGLVVAAGGSVMAFRPTKNDPQPGGGSAEPDTTLNDVGYVVLSVGVAFAVAGVIALVANRNSVDVNGKSVAARKSSSGFALTPNGFVF
jgi:hypothetical protein